MTIKDNKPGIVVLLALLFVFGASHRGKAQTLLIRGGLVHTIVRPPEVADVLIRDGKILEVAPSITSSADLVVDARGLFLYPGLIAATTQLGLTEINSVRATRDTAESGEFIPDVFSWDAVNPDSELIPVARANGITHAVPVPSGGIVTGNSGLIQLSGWTTEEMAVKKPVALHLFWPSSVLNLTPKEQFRDVARWKSLEDQAKEREIQRRKVEEFFEHASSYIRAHPSGTRGGDGFHPAWEGMRPFVEGKIPVMVHADSSKEIRAALDWAQRNQYRMILAGGRDALKFAKELAAANVPVIYEHFYSPPAHDVLSYSSAFEVPAKLRNEGVKVVLSLGLSGFSTANARNLPYLAAQAVAHGLSREDAIKSITLWPAEVLGVDSSLGSIEPGKEASLFLCTGDILSIPSEVTRMWMGGREVSLESRHTRLFNKYKARPQGKEKQ